METGMGVEVEVGIETVSCNSGKWEVKAQLLSYIFERRQGSPKGTFFCVSLAKRKKKGFWYQTFTAHQR